MYSNRGVPWAAVRRLARYPAEGQGKCTRNTCGAPRDVSQEISYNRAFSRDVLYFSVELCGIQRDGMISRGHSLDTTGKQQTSRGAPWVLMGRFHMFPAGCTTGTRGAPWYRFPWSPVGARGKKYHRVQHPTPPATMRSPPRACL